jgi:hypothetical protein
MFSRLGSNGTESPPDPLVNEAQLIATMRSTSRKPMLAITKNGPRSRSVSTPIIRPRRAERIAPTSMPSQGERPKFMNNSVEVYAPTPK